MSETKVKHGTKKHKKEGEESVADVEPTTDKPKKVNDHTESSKKGKKISSKGGKGDEEVNKVLEYDIIIPMSRLLLLPQQLLLSMYEKSPKTIRQRVFRHLLRQIHERDLITLARSPLLFRHLILMGSTQK